MRAWVFSKPGEPKEVLKLDNDWKEPGPLQEGQVLVRVKAAGLNPVGWKVVTKAPQIALKLPAVPELDCSGIVEESKDERFKVGDEIMGLNPALSHMRNGSGSLAEKIICPATHIAHKPSNVSWQEGASIGVCMTTAYSMIESAKVTKGSRVFVNGASGGVGTFAVQMAKARGAWVLASCSDRTREAVEKLSPDAIIDYRSDLIDRLSKEYPSTDEAKGLSAILDAMGSKEMYTKSDAYMKPGGIYVNIGPSGTSLSDIASFAGGMVQGKVLPSALGGTRAQYIMTSQACSPEQWSECSEMLKSGKVKPVIDSVYAFTEALEAIDKQMTGRAIGKIIVKVADD